MDKWKLIGSHSDVFITKIVKHSLNFNKNIEIIYKNNIAKHPKYRRLIRIDPNIIRNWYLHTAIKKDLYIFIRLKK